jgi:hypothetical protein
MSGQWACPRCAGASGPGGGMRGACARPRIGRRASPRKGTHRCRHSGLSGKGRCTPSCRRSGLSGRAHPDSRSTSHALPWLDPKAFKRKALARGRDRRCSYQVSQQTRSHTSPERGGRPPSEAKAVGRGDGKIRETSMSSPPTRLARLKAGVADLPRKRGRYGSLWRRRRRQKRFPGPCRVGRGAC